MRGELLDSILYFCKNWTLGNNQEIIM